MNQRLVVIAPGRGSYTHTELGSLRKRYPEAIAGDGLIARADALRRSRERIPISELDGAERSSPALHQAGENASSLIFTAAMLDFEALRRGPHKVVAVLGNSLGWYTSLATSGALSFEDAFQLVDEMGARQQGNITGGQVVYPIVGEDWRPDPTLLATVHTAIKAANGAEPPQAFISIRLGGSIVLAGTEEACAHLTMLLPPIARGQQRYPLRLALHSAFHTPLMSAAAVEARRHVDRLNWRRLECALIDGQGRRHLPLGATDPGVLRDITAGPQVLETYDFSAALRVALREYNPDQVVLLGPGSNLGASIAQVMIAEGWRGLRDRSAFQAAQERPDRPLVALGRPEQRQGLCGS